MKNWITICIPCYNVAAHIDKLFECLESQTFKFFDVIFIDDGSTDDTLKKVTYKANNSNLKDKITIFSQQNKGIAYTRNRLVDLSKNEYIFFLDPDDEIPSNSLESLFNATNNGQIDIVVGRARVILKDKFSLPFIVQYIYRKKMSSSHFVKSNLIVCWGSLLKKKILSNQRFLENYSYEDLGVMNYIYLKTINFKQIKDLVYIYKRRNESISDFSKKNKWKIIDLYTQANYAFSLYKKENWLMDKKMLRSINGTLFQIKIATLWLARYYSISKIINRLPCYSIEKLLSSYNLKIKFSKTFWKSLSFFYISFAYRNVLRTIKNNKNDLLSKVRVFDINKIKNKKNSIVFLDELNQEIILKYHNVLFFTTTNDFKAPNVYFGIRPQKITNELLNYEKIYFIDLRNIDKFNEHEIEIINSINPRIIIIMNKNNYPKKNNWLIID